MSGMHIILIFSSHRAASNKRLCPSATPERFMRRKSFAAAAASFRATLLFLWQLLGGVIVVFRTRIICVGVRAVKGAKRMPRGTSASSQSVNDLIVCVNFSRPLDGSTDGSDWYTTFFTYYENDNDTNVIMAHAKWLGWSLSTVAYEYRH